MPVVLTLGPITFADFEIPEDMPFGGKQMLVTRKLVGGDRVIDAMGRDDGDKKWSGRFRGANAETRGRQLDFLRIQGQQLVLSWSTFRYLVVIDSFDGNFKQPFEVPYSINCVVLQDLSSPVPAPQPDVDSSIFGDINGAGTLAGSINLPPVVSAVASVASTANAVAKFVGASPSQVAGVQSSIQTALGVVNSQQVVQNGAVASSGSVMGMTGGLQPQALAAQLSGQSAAFGQLGQLYQLQSLLGRTSVNVANAGS
jgi:hypothetical protein